MIGQESHLAAVLHFLQVLILFGPLGHEGDGRANKLSDLRMRAVKPRGVCIRNKIFIPLAATLAASPLVCAHFPASPLTNLSLLACAPNKTASYADYCIESGWLDFDVAGCFKLCHFVMALFVLLFLNKG